MLTFIVAMFVGVIWVFIAGYCKVSFPAWVWVINGILSWMAAEGIVSALNSIRGYYKNRKRNRRIL